MPAMRAPTKSSPRLSSAWAMASQEAAMSSTDSVKVVGSQAVVPRRASSTLETLMPSALRSLVAWLKKPWMCVSTRPGPTMHPV